ncbi:MAG: hypothetical protein IJ839_01400 [Ruminobacter sp.]|nr:hypothetical protein [Ruminobacter sp.]
MDIGKLNIKYDFTEGYEGEPYLVFKIKNSNELTLKIWEGLVADMLENPDMSGSGWKGLTRDYHELKGIWTDGDKEVEINVSEYLADLLYYSNKSFDYEETLEMFESLHKYLNYAKEQGYSVIAKFVD